MTTNILQLPQIDGPNTTFAISNNSDWVDALYFGQPIFGSTLALSGCTLANGSNVISVPTTNGIQPGMMISPVPGLIAGAFVGTITSSTQLTAVDAGGFDVNATGSTVAAYLVFTAPPLDLTGIAFLANIRAIGSTRIFLTAQTADSTMTNGGTSGILAFNVPTAKMRTVPAGTYGLDILGLADNNVVNLMQNGAATVTVTKGISDATTVQALAPSIAPSP